MRNKNLSLFAVAASIVLVNCGGSSDSSTYKGTYTVDGVKYTCNSEDAFNACREGDCSSCTNDAPAPTTEEPEVTQCKTSGNTVLVDEGTTCKNGSDTLSCSGNKVTLNGSITAQTININGKTYTCQ